jgi:hypothetical protein
MIDFEQRLMEKDREADVMIRDLQMRLAHTQAQLKEKEAEVERLEALEGLTRCSMWQRRLKVNYAMASDIVQIIKSEAALADTEGEG